jgi:hypothetical protein
MVMLGHTSEVLLLPLLRIPPLPDLLHPPPLLLLHLARHCKPLHMLLLLLLLLLYHTSLLLLLIDW